MKEVGAGAALVSAHSDTDDRRVLDAHLGGLAKDARGGFDAEVTDGVEDPIDADAVVLLGAFAGAFERREDRFQIRTVPVVNDADSDVDLGVHDSLRGEALEHAPGDELVVLRRAQAVGDSLEGHQEAGKIRVLIKRERLVE